MARLPLCFHPAVTVANSLKQGHGLVVAHLRAKELLADELASAGLAEISSPKEKPNCAATRLTRRSTPLLLKSDHHCPCVGLKLAMVKMSFMTLEEGGDSRLANKLTIEGKRPLQKGLKQLFTAPVRWS